jgi:hypothetical protein
VGVHGDSLDQSGYAHPIGGGIKDIADAAPNKLRPPDESRNGSVTKFWPPWGRGQSDRHRAKGLAGAYLPVFDTLEVELGIKVVPVSDIHFASSGSDG